ncbi:TniQ family protein [Photobacterium sp. DNB22_13_2]
MILGARNNQSLAVRLTPLPGESVHGFLMRLSIVNACRYSELLRFLGVHSHRNLFGLPGSFVENRLFSTLSRVLNLEETKLREVFTIAQAESLWSPCVTGTTEMLVNSIRVCTTCLSESLHHRHEWQHALYCVCPEHNQLLVESCQNCGEPLQVDTCFVGSCIHCGSSTKNWNIEESTVPLWQQRILEKSGYDTLLVPLLEVARIAVRDTDLFSSDIRVRDMRVVEVMKLMNKSWVLLNSEAARKSLKDSLLSKWKWESSIVGEEILLTLYLEAENLAIGTEYFGEENEWRYPIFESPERELEILKSTKGVAIKLVGDQVGGLVRATEVLKLLGVKPSSMKEMHQRGVFTLVNPNTARKYALYDFTDVVNRIAQIPMTDKTIDGFLPYADFATKACKFAVVSESEILDDIFKQKLPAVRLANDNGTILDNLLVDKEAFDSRYMDLEQRIFSRKSISIDELPSFFGTVRDNVQSLIQTQFFKEIVDVVFLEAREQVLTQDLKQITDSYLILNTWAHRHNKSKTKCLCALKRSGIEPLVRVQDRYCGSFEIYPKSAEGYLLDRYEQLSPSYEVRKRRRKK